MHPETALLVRLLWGMSRSLHRFSRIPEPSLLPRRQMSLIFNVNPLVDAVLPVRCVYLVLPS